VGQEEALSSVLIVPDIFFENAPPGSVVFISPVDEFYNCVGWAVHRKDVIWPDEDEQWRWPPEIRRDETRESFERFFSLLGFVRSANTRLERGYEKVAIYIKDGLVKHVARQYPTGREKGYWTSKLGAHADVRHTTPEVIQGSSYGFVALIMKRPFDSRRPKLPALHPPAARLVSPTGRPLVR
jgi:hypothetical protein